MPDTAEASLMVLKDMVNPGVDDETRANVIMEFVVSVTRSSSVSQRAPICVDLCRSQTATDSRSFVYVTGS